MIRRNVLIFHSGGLGDFVLSWPLGLALGRLHPQSRIIYVTQASKGALVAEALGLDWRDQENSWAALYSDPCGLSDANRNAIFESHSVYSFLAAPGDAFCRNVASLSPQAAVVTLRIAPPPGFAGHGLDHLVIQLSDHPAVAAAVTQIRASIQNHGLGRRAAGGALLIHPGSGSRAKCWPVASFVRLIKKLRDAGQTVNVLLGEVELERFSGEELGQLESAAPVVRPAAYVDLYAALSAGAGFIGHDSGPTHLAAMMGLPTLALFGRSEESVWRPIGPCVRVVRHYELDSLNADDVFEAWKRPAAGIS